MPDDRDRVGTRPSAQRFCSHCKAIEEASHGTNRWSAVSGRVLRGVPKACVSQVVVRFSLMGEGEREQDDQATGKPQRLLRRA